MTPESFIDRALGIPFAFGHGDWLGTDCWGLVELWYHDLLGIALDDRVGRAPSHANLAEGLQSGEHWEPVGAPTDHDLVVMRAGGLESGHVGIHYGGSVLHAIDPTGCVYQPLADRRLRSSITGFLTYR